MRSSGKLGGGVWSGGYAARFFRSVGQRDGGAVDDFDGATLQRAPGTGALVGHAGGGGKGFRKLGERQPDAGAAVSAVFWRDAGAVLQAEQRLKLADNFASADVGLHRLPEHAPEGAPASVDAVATVLFLVRLGEERVGHAGTEALFHFAEGGGAHRGDAGGQGPAPEGEERSVFHGTICRRAVYIPLA